MNHSETLPRPTEIAEVEYQDQLKKFVYFIRFQKLPALSLSMSRLQSYHNHRRALGLEAVRSSPKLAGKRLIRRLCVCLFPRLYSKTHPNTHLACIGFAIMILRLIELQVPTHVIGTRGLDLFTVAIPPALPIGLTIGTVFAVDRLKRRRSLALLLPE